MKPTLSKRDPCWKPTSSYMGINQFEILQNWSFIAKLTAYFKIACLIFLTDTMYFLLNPPQSIFHLYYFMPVAFQRSPLVSTPSNWLFLKIWPLGIIETFGNFEIHCMELSFFVLLWLDPLGSLLSGFWNNCLLSSNSGYHLPLLLAVLLPSATLILLKHLFHPPGFLLKSLLTFMR